MHLSLVIPAHNEAGRLPATLERLRAYLDARPWDSEVLVVENASTDGTFALASDFARAWPRLRVLRETRRGKGLAVGRGMREARGAFRFLCDADLSVPVEEVEALLPPALPDWDVVIGSREAPGAVRIGEPAYRHLSGRVFNWLARRLLPDLQDTQCGFKGFRGPVAEEVFSRQRIHGFAFDVEALVIARALGYRIVERPVRWTFEADTRVSVLRDTVPMLVDLLRVHRNLRAGRYAGAVLPACADA